MITEMLLNPSDDEDIEYVEAEIEKKIIIDGKKIYRRKLLYQF